MLQRGYDVALCDTLPVIPTTSEDVAVIIVALAEDEETDEPHGCTCKNVEKLFHDGRTERVCFYCVRVTKRTASERKAVECFQVCRKEKSRPISGLLVGIYAASSMVWNTNKEKAILSNDGKRVNGGVLP